MKTLIAMILLTIALPLKAGPSVSLTFDDGLDPRSQPEAATWNAQILKTLETEGIKAAFFPAGRFVDSPEGLALVRAWGDAGHMVGNHTYSHTDIDTMTLEAYIADISRGDQLFKAMPRFKPMLRFPYLREGATAEKRDGVRAWLAKNGYSPAPVSIVTGDGYYSGRLTAGLVKSTFRDTGAFRLAYVKHIVDRAAYYEKVARETLGRSPHHVMLLHANRVNATFLRDAIAGLRAAGWTIVDAQMAFADPLYARQAKGLPANSSIVTSLARDAGRPVPPAPEEDWGKATLDALGY
ncbi:polysaccharide deacetylase family protein [Usitatibacter palustris]|uniref:NodB homology domain-containing protein n=1 Tax=Usitatibacter palustris TaxID=2732487 RepID=A0A6M4H2W8_9PROT|nr:polysaccharide deacetylase family protein [Usitatibacter palustris]QJR13921.1 hypothetical protein DSM104440_00713 [Usitatibacter palustris]